MDTLEQAKELKRDYERKYYQRMSKEQKKKRVLYQKEWRKKNPEKVRAINQRYWINKVKRKEVIKNERTA